MLGVGIELVGVSVLSGGFATSCSICYNVSTEWLDLDTSNRVPNVARLWGRGRSLGAIAKPIVQLAALAPCNTR